MAQPAMEQINYIGKNLTKQVFAGSKCLVESRKGVVKFPPPQVERIILRNDREN